MSDQTAVEALRALLARNPERPDGWKVALNFPAVQRKLGLSHALAAPLLRLQTHTSVPQPSSGRVHVEAELALKQMTEENRELRIQMTGMQAQARGDNAEAGLQKRMSDLALQEYQWAAQQKELQLQAQIARLQAQLAGQHYQTMVANNGARSE